MTEQKNTRPEYLYKIMSKDGWNKSVAQKKFIYSEIDTDFIHLATEEQIIHVINKFWNNKDYVVLKINSSELLGRLAYEVNPGGSTKFFHLYEGDIPLSSVLEVSDTPLNHYLSESCKEGIEGLPK